MNRGYSPKKGDRTPMHSHPSSVVYVLKGGRVKYTLPDGSTKISELKTGEALLRPPVTHSDEARHWGAKSILSGFGPIAPWVCHNCGRSFLHSNRARFPWKVPVEQRETKRSCR